MRIVQFRCREEIRSSQKRLDSFSLAEKRFSFLEKSLATLRSSEKNSLVKRKSGGFRFTTPWLISCGHGVRERTALSAKGGIGWK